SRTGSSILLTRSRRACLDCSRSVAVVGTTSDPNPMNRIFVVGLLALGGLGFAHAPHQSDYRVVFDLTSRDTLDQKAVLRWVDEVSTASSEAQVEVVMY